MSGIIRRSLVVDRSRLLCTRSPSRWKADVSAFSKHLHADEARNAPFVLVSEDIRTGCLSQEKISSREPECRLDIRWRRSTTRKSLRSPSLLVGRENPRSSVRSREPRRCSSVRSCVRKVTSEKVRVVVRMFARDAAFRRRRNRSSSGRTGRDSELP